MNLRDTLAIAIWNRKAEITCDLCGMRLEADASAMEHGGFVISPVEERGTWQCWPCLDNNA
tara:strand:- start:361 stop:543 length:183 start_codon:yes stop_codon:yes gene_type:complete